MHGAGSSGKPLGGSRFLTLFLTLAILWFSVYLLGHFRDTSFQLDFEPYYFQAKAIRVGTPPPYEVTGTKRDWNLIPTLPLTYSILLSPLSLLRETRAYDVFFFLNLGFLTLSLFLLQRIVELSAFSRKLLWGIALILYPVLHCLHVGNLGLVLLFLLSSSLVLYKRNRVVASAFLLALTASIKVTPGLLILVFLAHRKFRFCTAFSLSFMALQAVTTGATSWSDTWYYWTELFPELSSQVSLYIYNQSLIGFWNRLGEYLGYQIPYLNQMVAAGVLGGFVLYLFLKHKELPNRNLSPVLEYDEMLFEICALLILINISTPIGWVHHYAWIVLPIALILRSSDDGRFESSDIVMMTLGVFLLFVPLGFVVFRAGSIQHVLISGHILLGSLIVLFEMWRLQSKRSATMRTVSPEATVRVVLPAPNT